MFLGDVLQWPSFWDQFSVTVHDTDLPVLSKFTYLMSLLKGEPKQAIHGLSLTADQYAIACKILKDRFGRKETIIFTHIQKLLHLSVPFKCTVSALWKLNDELQAHTRSLEALGIDGKQYGVILTPMILCRMPHDIRMEWSRDGAGHERSQVFRDSMSVSGKTTVEERRPKVPTASALPSSLVPGKVKLNCGVCNKGHLTEKCFKLNGPIIQRREKLRAAGLCFRCLHPGHIAKGCARVCYKCSGRHHELLCVPASSSDLEI